jgi:hypothetical protein
MTMKLKIVNEDATRVAKVTTVNGDSRSVSEIAPGSSVDAYLHQTCSLLLEEKPAEDPAPVLAWQEHIMQFFACDHLAPHLQAVSKPFCDLAKQIVDTTPRNPERTVALRKLLEAKDAAVRALLAKAPDQLEPPK